MIAIIILFVCCVPLTAIGLFVWLIFSSTSRH